MATRVQAQYAPQGTGLQRVTARQVETVQAQFQAPQEDSATRLARALGALDPNVIGGSLSRIQEVNDAEERRRAQAYANSKTLDELGKEIREGKLLPSQSPVFGATIQHIYGENSQKALERDTLSKLSSGELKFTTEQELDAYLTEARNSQLEGQSEYTIAGFDKGWNQFRGQAAVVNLKINDNEAVNRGISEASDNLSNVLLDVTAPTFQGTDEDRAKTLMSRYELLTATQLLRADARKEALSNLLVRIASSGNQGLLNTMLSQKLPNGGPTIAGLLGDRVTMSLGNAAESQFDRDQRQRVDVELAPFMRDAATGSLNLGKLEAFRAANEKYVSSATIEALIRSNEAAQARIDKLNAQHGFIMAAQAITAEATQRASALVADRRGYEMPDIQVPTPEGNLKTVKGSDLVLAEVQRRIAAQPDMAFDEQVRLYANNSSENAQWKADLNAAYVNIGEVGVDAKGKPVGELLPGTVEALNRFSVINQISTGYARQLAGGEDKYQALVNIQALRESGVADPNLAASLVNQAERNTAKNIESINTKVNSAVNAITNPGVFSGRFWGEVFSGEWGEGEKNLRVVQGAVRSLAKAYMAANVASTGEEAVQKAVEYYANPAVSTQINNTIYFNKDLPRVPEQQDQRFWFQRYMDEEVATYLKDQGITSSAGDIVLQPMLGGEPRYMLHLNGTPLGKEFLRRDVEAWITERDKRDIADRIKAKQPKENPEESFITSETPGGAQIVYRKPKR
ncbi:internal virion protein C [Bordetella phage vB_BbrP_BB8]|uniref:Internal virion protein C n=1 Tax=Bordetella phage vB_BbrP_BB8 TaxID=2587820 RepID=A0A4Y5TNS3_9CAUD|nr:internal virion protein C [Bordetella phage vB_BbrP_BB8]